MTAVHVSSWVTSEWKLVTAPGMRGLLEPAVVLHLPSVRYAIVPMMDAVDPEAEYARQKIAAVTQNVFSSAVTGTA